MPKKPISMRLEVDLLDEIKEHKSYRPPEEGGGGITQFVERALEFSMECSEFEEYVEELEEE